MSSIDNAKVEAAVEAYSNAKFEFDQFRKRIVNHFLDHPDLNSSPLPILHSIKSRLKDADHLKKKIERKWEKDGPIDESNVFDKITDLAGVRVLHLYLDQFENIHQEISKQISDGEWHLHEDPIAYTWDPETKDFFQRIGIGTDLKPSYYTSVHYLLKPRSESHVKLELQVRTLYEEVWGEVDHAINYPKPTESITCRDQIRVLAKLTSTGSRLVDSIFRAHQEHQANSADSGEEE